MPSDTWLTLIVPGISAALMSSARNDSANSEHLARFAGRGSLRCPWSRQDVENGSLQPWQRGLLAMLELPSSASDFPSAAVSARGGGIAAGGYWMHLDFVHFAAGLDRLTFLPLVEEASVQDSESSAIATALTDHLQSCGMVLHTLPDGGCCISSENILDVVTCSPDAAAARELPLAMPQGSDAGVLRRLMTEIQMLLHDHPVNEVRARRNLPAINAGWLWGTGPVSARAVTQTLPPAMADDLYLRGIYSLHGQSCAPAPANCAAMLADLAKVRRAVAVIAVADSSALESKWLQPLSAAVATRRLTRLDLVLDDWHLQVGRTAMRRFWRKPRPPAEWLV